MFVPPCQYGWQEDSEGEGETSRRVRGLGGFGCSWMAGRLVLECG